MAGKKTNDVIQHRNEIIEKKGRYQEENKLCVENNSG
jgi:hypothetical protein